MRGVVFAKHKVLQVVFTVNNGQGIQLMVKNNIVGFGKTDPQRSGDESVHGRHEGRNLFFSAHTGKTVVTAGDQT